MAVIDIPQDAMRIISHRTSYGARVTYPRVVGMVVSLVFVAGGLAGWWALLGDDSWSEPLTYALLLLLISPGGWGLQHALRPRPLIRLTETELVVRWGPALLERLVARLPVETLEVRVARDEIDVIRVDGAVLRATFASAVVPFYRSKISPVRAGLYLLQVRNTGQENWLSVIGSQVQSEVENARLTLIHAGDLDDLPAIEIDHEADDDPAEDSTAEGDRGASAAPSGEDCEDSARLADEEPPSGGDEPTEGHDGPPDENGKPRGTGGETGEPARVP
jgi:hypothetical protein